MTAKSLLRVAAISLLIIVCGHSTTLIPREPRDLTETLVLKGMKTYEMNLFGSMRTYWDFHQGMSIIMISSELLEIIGMSDRIYVISDGSVVGEMNGSEATEEKIMTMAV